jgi:hypothetical protein
MSADLLRQAAERIEQLAGDCPTNTADYRHLCSFLSRGNGGVIGQPTLQWWNTMGPDIGAPLAAVLRMYADACERHVAGRPVEDLIGDTPAFALARAILGEQP